MKRKIVFICFVSIVFCGCDLFNIGITYGEDAPVEILNSSFENPQNGAADVLNGAVDWVSGGLWYGIFRWPGGVPDGEYAVWSTYNYNGNANPENGFSQELSASYTVGKYSLSIKTLGDNTAGLTSRLILGYDSGANEYVELTSNDVVINYLSTDVLETKWITQTVELEIKKSSKVLGKPVWIRFSSVTNAAGQGGNSCWWDDVKLTYAAPL